MAHRRQITRGVPFRNKADAGKPSCIWSLKARIRPQCRVTTPLWAPGADSGQRAKTRIRGGNSERKWLQRTPLGSPGDDTSQLKVPSPFSRLLRPLNKCFTLFGFANSDRKNLTPQKTPKQNGLFMGFPGTLTRSNSRLSWMPGNKA